MLASVAAFASVVPGSGQRTAWGALAAVGQLLDANRHLAQFRALGINVVSVSVDDVEEIAKFARAQKIEYTMLADPSGAINLSLRIHDE